MAGNRLLFAEVRPECPIEELAAKPQRSADVAESLRISPARLDLHRCVRVCFIATPWWAAVRIGRSESREGMGGSFS